MKYFDHDTEAGKDDKVVALRLRSGGAAVDAYWCVLEEIYRTETEFATEKNQAGFVALAHRLCVDVEVLSDWFSAMVEIGLLEPTSDGKAVTSGRATANIAQYKQRQETARQNGKLGGRKPKQNQAKTKAVSNWKAKKTQPETKEKEKLLDTHKGYPNNYASGDAAAADAAPPAAKPHCPLCDAEMPRHDGTAMWWECRTCGAVKAEAVVWR